MKDRNIFVIGAHPDDEILGCGGTIAKIVSNNTVSVLILGGGITSRDLPNSELKIESIRADALAAHKIIGINESYFEKFPDNRFDEIPLLDIVKKVSEYINKVDPDVVLTHHYGDLNIDHRLTFQAVLTSCRPQPGFKCPDIYCFEIPSSTEWQVNSEGYMFKPNVFIDISTTIDKKLNALEKYKSEMRKYPHSRSLKGIETMAQDWGRKMGRKYVEAFELIRSLRNHL